MYKRANTSEPITTSARPFFSGHAATTPFFNVQPTLQTKAEDTQQEDSGEPVSTVIHEVESTASTEAPVPPPDEAPSDEGASRTIPAVQTKLTVGPADDPYEREADAIADRVVHGAYAPEPTPRQAAPTPLQRQTEDGEEEEVLQAKGDASGEAPDTVQEGIEQSRGAGLPLSQPTQEGMESSFGVDFSGVRVHTDSNAQSMNQQLNSRAFTHGSDIYFNSGEYQPDADSGRHLLAHELTHVVQQNPGLMRKTRDTSSTPNISTTDNKQIQASRSFGPVDFMPKGTTIHQSVLSLFVSENSDLFTEVKIPGATRHDVETGKVGVADFYKAAATGGMSRTIAINFDSDEPTYLRQDSKLQFGGGAYKHNVDAAPKGAKNSPKVRNAGLGPVEIKLGDLKPGHSAEAILGGPQVNNYIQGINNTASSIKTYLVSHGSESDGSGSWSPHPNALGKGDLTIPAKLTYPGGSGLSHSQLAVYENGKTKVVYNSGLKGAMYVYKHDTAGVWVYEWIPDTIPATTGSGDVDNVLRRLESEVIKPIQTKRKDSKPPSLAVHTARIQRAPKSTFPYKKWQGDYNNWQKSAQTLIGSEKEKDKEQILEALLEVESRSGNKVNLPGEVKHRAKGFGKIRHWNRLGGIYGWLRNTFDGVYTKFKKFSDKIKKKVRNLSRRLGSTSFGSWVKATAKVIFKIFKMVGAWTVHQVMEKLIGSLQEGLSNNLRKLVEEVTPEGVKSKVELFQERKAEYEQLIKEKQEELEKKIFGDKLALFDKLSEFEAIADKASTIVTVVEWGVRLLACAAPPAVGCLWNLAISALQAAFAMLIQTCWFTKKVYAPIINTIEPVKRFPTEVAAFVVEKANTVIPVPEGFEPLFAPIVIDTGEFKPDCDESSGPPLTPERAALLELLDEVGEDKFRAMLEVIAKRGAGPWVLLTVERIQALKEPLSKVELEELKSAAVATEGGIPIPLEEFLNNISQYSKREKKLIKEAKEAREAKETAKGGKGDATKGEDSGPEYKDPLYTPPGTIDQHLGVAFSALTPGDALEAGRVYPAPINIYLLIAVADGDSKYIVRLSNVSVKVKSVTDKEVIFINQKTFYAYYSESRFLEVPAKYEIPIPKERVLNYD